LFPIAWRAQRYNAGIAWAKVFDHRLDRAILAGGVATFDDDKDALAALNHAALQLHELDLQTDQQRVIPMAAQMLRKRWPVLHGAFLLVASGFGHVERHLHSLVNSATLPEGDHRIRGIGGG
jgi:hypothetical protein